MLCHEVEFARTVFSIWSWFALGVIVIVWTPMVAIVRLVTMPFDKGAYAAGYLFRKLTVVHERLTPLWKFRTSGTLPDDMRRPYVVVSNHESFVDILLISHLPDRDEVDVEDRDPAHPAGRLDDAPGPRHPTRAR